MNKSNQNLLFSGNWEVFSPLTYGKAFKEQGLKSKLIPSSQVQARRDCFIFLWSYFSQSTKRDSGVLFRESQKMLMENCCQKTNIHQKKSWCVHGVSIDEIWQTA